MHAIYDTNNLPFWSESEIQERAHLAERFEARMRQLLQERNRAWSFERIEAPMLIPRELLSPEYDEDQIFAIPPKISSLRQECASSLRADRSEFDRLASAMEPHALPADAWEALLAASEDDSAAARWDPRLDALALAWASRRDRLPKALALRPETTPATYAWMARKMAAAPSSLPYCCWQLNKSFRREQDQPSKHMRLKEFWQQEFQCAYSSDSMEDWQAYVVEPVKELIADLTRCPARIVVSDRLPAYSVRTLDVEVWNSQKWMEICSISKRLDFPDQVQIPQKASQPRREAIVCEVATSPDRQHYCSKLWREAWDSLPRDEWADQDWRSSLVSNADAALARRALLDAKR